MATHQVAKFCISSKLSYKRVVRRIGKYLKATVGKGMIFKPDGRRSLEWYTDADFFWGWDKADLGNPEVVLSKTGYMLMYANCPVLFCIELQT